MTWLEPWQPVGDGSSLESQLQREMGAAHGLYNVAVKAIARRIDRTNCLNYLTVLGGWPWSISRGVPASRNRTGPRSESFPTGEPSWMKSWCVTMRTAPNQQLGTDA